MKYSEKKMNSLKKGDGEGGGPTFKLRRGSWASTFKLLGDPGSRVPGSQGPGSCGPGPTFTPCHEITQY